MKKSIVAILITIISGFAIGQRTSNLIVFSEGGEPFYLIVNGIRQNAKPQTNIKIEGLNAPYYHTKIIFVDKTIPNIEKSALSVKDFDDKFCETTYGIKENKKGKFKLKWKSAVPLEQAIVYSNPEQVIIFTTIPKPPIASVIISETITNHTNEGVSLNLNVGNNNRGTNQTTVSQTISNNGTITQTSSTSTQTNTGDNVGVNINVDGINLGVNINDGGLGQTTTTQTTTVTTNSSIIGHDEIIVIDDPIIHDDNPYLEGYNGEIGCNGWPMTPSAFSSAKRSIESKDFSDSKLTLAKQIANSNCLTALQVKEIMLLFDFEAAKLKYAKHAYSRTFDIGNYYMINDAFSFESSIEELNEFISK